MNLDILNQEYKVLVTGGAGFIGGALVRKLLKNHNLKVFNLDKLSYASDLNGINSCENSKNHFLFEVDLFNYEATQKAFLESNPDIVIHLAAESHVDRSIENPRKFLDSNIIGTFNILEISKKHWLNLKAPRKNVFRFIHVSTDEVFGSLGNKGFFSEKTAYDPRSPYSATKAASDHLVKAWHHTYKFPIIKTNCSNNFGPFQFPEKLIPLIIIKALERLPIPIYGKGDNIRDWLYVEDHVDALLQVINKGKIGETYCIGGNNEKSNLEIATIICSMLQREIPSKYPYSDLIRFVEDRPGHDKRYAINSEYIKKELGWQPANSFNQAIHKTIKWYINNQDWCKNIRSKGGYSGERIGLYKINS